VGQVAIVVTLRSGAEEQARALVEEGPPFDLADSGLTRHTIFLSAGEAVFIFEGPEVEWLLDDLVDDPFGPVPDALDRWRPLVEGPARLARVAFAWPTDPSTGAT
jgi:hypothetical protein